MKFFERKIKAAFIDVDNVLVHAETGNPTSPSGERLKDTRENARELKAMETALRNQLRELRNCGVTPVLCTGRESEYVERLQARLELKGLPFIAENGGVVAFNPGNKVVTASFPRKITEGGKEVYFSSQKEFLEHVRERLYGFGIERFADEYRGTGKNVVGKERLPLRDTMIGLQVAGFYSGLYDKHSPGEIREKREELYKAIQGFFNENPHLKPYFHAFKGSPHAVDILPREVSRGLGIKAEKVDKGLGVRLLAKRLKINLARTAAVGDAENDLPFMLLVKRKGVMAIAPANAEETVKRQADFVTKSRVTQGAIEAMQKIQSARKRFRTWGER